MRWLQWTLGATGTALLLYWGVSELDTRIYQEIGIRRLSGISAGPPRSEDRSPREEPNRPARATRARAEAASRVPFGIIQVPRLSISAVISEGIDSRTLRRAVGHIPETPFPGEPGNVGLAGHRDSFFRGLKDTKIGDSIRVATRDGIYRYRVDSIRIVGPDRWDVLDPLPHPTLTLVTCYPFYYVGNAPKRFIVQARQVAPDGEPITDRSAAPRAHRPG